MDYLSIECPTLAIYRLGRAIPYRRRLVKAVLPFSFHARQMLSRTCRLAHFHPAKVFLRPSLPKSERERLN